MAINVPYKHPRGTRAALNTLATGSNLLPGQIYLLTDESRIAVATTTSTYETFAKENEAGGGTGGTAWGPVTATGTGASQNITLPEECAVGDVLVFVAGVHQPTSNYSISGTTLTTTQPSGQPISVVRYGVGEKGDTGATGSGGVWGTITGTLSSQTDLQTLLDGKASTSHNHDGTYATAAHNHTGTYQPLATVLTNTTASFTTALQTKLNAITGTNTGDQTLNVTIGISAIGKPSNSQRLLRFVATYAVTISEALSRATAGTAATGAASFTVSKNGTSIGTIAWSAAGTTGTVDLTSATIALAAGDVLTIDAPATADATLADISISLHGTY